ncbi:hypothetical protein [Pseudaquidulcibacter saccharophilus]|uniref:hypothetical protein n=1 Tax=Pseudaquidulcibacter saccharophilus TaxID=2831900 RepID=UPI001EFEF7C0|nr:hypothetical protein [Pseudaquidulcibacter saccharophilus]
MKYFEEFGKHGFHSAFMTTFAFGAQAFEDIPYPKLRRSGCRNIIVLADRQMTNQSLSDFGAAKSAGSGYHLIKTSAPGAFHPKITMLIGNNIGKLYVGSANLTALGLGGNRELLATISYDKNLPENSVFFAKAIEYIRGYVPNDDPWFEAAYNRAIQSAPWLSDAVSKLNNISEMEHIRLLTDRPEKTLIEQIVECVGSDKIEKLIIMSPYWDERLSGLGRLGEALGNPELHILVEKNTQNFPKLALSSLSSVKLFEVDEDAKGRFLHAKLFIAIGKEWDHVISGSINCSFPALMGPKHQGNAEAGIYTRVETKTALERLDLQNYLNLPIREEDLPDLELQISKGVVENIVRDGGQLTLSNSRLIWKAPEVKTNNWIKLQLFSREDISYGQPFDLHGEPSKVWAIDLEADGTRPKYGLIQFEDYAYSAPIIVTDLNAISQATLPPQLGRAGKLSETLSGINDEDLCLIEILNELEMIELNSLEKTEPTIKAAQQDTNEDSGNVSYKLLKRNDFEKARIEAQKDPKSLAEFSVGRINSAANQLSTVLNRLIGIMSDDFDSMETQEILKAESLDFTISEPVDVCDEVKSNEPPLLIENATNSAEIIENYRRKEMDKTNARQILSLVNEFEKRGQHMIGSTFRTTELVRFRAMIQIILNYAQPIRGKPRKPQILPLYTREGFDWPRLICRILFCHFGRFQVWNNLVLEPNEDEQNRVIEYLVIANWAANAVNKAIESSKELSILKQIFENVSKQIRLIYSQTISEEKANADLVKLLEAKFQDRFGGILS